MKCRNKKLINLPHCGLCIGISFWVKSYTNPGIILLFFASIVSLLSYRILCTTEYDKRLDSSYTICKCCQNKGCLPLVPNRLFTFSPYCLITFMRVGPSCELFKGQSCLVHIGNMSKIKPANLIPVVPYIELWISTIKLQPVHNQMLVMGWNILGLVGCCPEWYVLPGKEPVKPASGKLELLRSWVTIGVALHKSQFTCKLKPYAPYY